MPTDPCACFLDFCSSASVSDLCFQLSEEVRQTREESKFGVVLVASKQAVSEQSHCGRVPRRRPGMANALGPEPLPHECRLCLTARRLCAKRPRVPRRRPPEAKKSDIQTFYKQNNPRKPLPLFQLTCRPDTLLLLNPNLIYETTFPNLNR